MILDERGIEMKKNDWILGGGIVLAKTTGFLGAGSFWLPA